MNNRSIRERLIAAVGEEWADVIGDAVAGWLVRGGYLSMASMQGSRTKAPASSAEQEVPHDRPDQSVRAELLAKLELQREVILQLCERVDRLERRADGLTPMQRVEAQWADKRLDPAAPAAPVPPAEGEARNLPHYTEGVCSDGAAILRDGVMMPIERIVSELNRLTALIAEFRPVPVSERLPRTEDCIRWGDDDWCWGQERSLLTGHAAARWRLMQVGSLEDEAMNWLPAGALPLPRRWEGPAMT